LKIFSYLSEGLRAISHYFGREKKEKLKFGRSQATSALTEVDFSEMKQALDFLPERMK
jgi:hypothetical protein